MELESRTVVSCHVSAGHQTGSSGRAISAHNFRTISPVPNPRLLASQHSCWCPMALFKQVPTTVLSPFLACHLVTCHMYHKHCLYNCCPKHWFALKVNVRHRVRVRTTRDSCSRRQDSGHRDSSWLSWVLAERWNREKPFLYPRGASED